MKLFDPGVYDIEVARLLQAITPPMPHTVWGVRILPAMVHRRMAAGLLDVTPYAAKRLGARDMIAWREYHIRRIAYLAMSGWRDAIELDFGVPSLGYYNTNPVIDGNHRLCASIIRKDATIRAWVGGQISYASELLGFHYQEAEEENQVTAQTAQCGT